MIPSSTVVTVFTDSIAQAGYEAVQLGKRYRYHVRAYDTSPLHNLSEPSLTIEALASVGAPSPGASPVSAAIQ